MPEWMQGATITLRNEMKSARFSPAMRKQRWNITICYAMRGGNEC